MRERSRKPKRTHTRMHIASSASQMGQPTVTYVLSLLCARGGDCLACHPLLPSSLPSAQCRLIAQSKFCFLGQFTADCPLQGAVIHRYRIFQFRPKTNVRHPKSPNVRPNTNVREGFVFARTFGHFTERLAISASKVLPPAVGPS